ncbi:MAG: hypothetical protein HQ483_10195 [Rhodospirillales bacterium]|nr:hypothetical protein [Rhodospirillales bacterium]
METVAPRPTPPGPTVSAPPPTAQLSAPPPELQRLEIGSKLDALVLQATGKGLAEINSPFGKLQIATSFPLPANAALQLQIIGKFPLFQLLILSVNGQSPQALLRTAAAGSPAALAATNPGAAQATSANATARPAPASLNLTVGTTVIATKVGGPGALTPAAAPVAGALAVPSGTAPGTPVTGPATGVPAGPGPSLQTANPNPTTGAPASPAPGAQPDNSGLNQPGNRFSVRIVQLTPPAQLSSTGGLPASGNPLFTVGQTATGVVISTNTLGHAVVQTHAGPVNLAVPSPLPAGTTISFLINAPLPPLPANSPPAWLDRNASVIMETHKWPELDDALRALSESHPTLGQQVTGALLPKADATLAANIILLISAIRGGDIRNWFGDAPVRALQRIRPELMTRLRDDFTQMSRLADDSSGNDWRSYPVPFLNGQEIEQIRFFVRRKSANDDEDADADQGTRFVIDLDLSQIGRLQLDGLVKAQSKQFDLIIRTDRHLDVAWQNQIRGIYQNAMEQTATGGGLVFQAAPANFLDIQTNDASSRDSGLVV